MPGRGGAAEYFAWVDEARRSRDLALRQLRDGPPRGGAPCAGGLADPVLARVLFDEDARRRLAAAERELAEARRRVAWLRRVFSRTADVLELRHVEGLRWEEAAARMGVSASTAKRWHRALVEWVDSFGWARARDGRGTAEV